MPLVSWQKKERMVDKTGLNLEKVEYLHTSLIYRYFRYLKILSLWFIWKILIINKLSQTTRITHLEKYLIFYSKW